MVTYEKIGNKNSATNVYAVTYSINSLMDSTRAGTTAKTFTSTFSITFTYKCSTSDSTIYGITNVVINSVL